MTGADIGKFSIDQFIDHRHDLLDMVRGQRYDVCRNNAEGLNILKIGFGIAGGEVLNTFPALGGGGIDLIVYVCDVADIGNARISATQQAS